MHACMYACVRLCASVFLYVISIHMSCFVKRCEGRWHSFHHSIVPGAVSFATFDFAHGSLQALGKG